MDWLIQDFILMAADQNEPHEKNKDQEFKHGDGWGIAYLENNKLKLFRSKEPIYEDDQINDYRNLETNFLILHARKASKGNVEIRNVHPFECTLNGKQYLFFHNGTIHDELAFDSAFKPVGATDSERLFYYLLTNSNGQLTPAFLKSKLENLKDFSAANFILTDGKMTYSGNWYSENPNYYSLKVLQKPGQIVVASEVLPHYKTEDWIKLKNQDIVSVGTSDLSININ
ncbi:MAG: class II glutamine amidotransferase [bacterium]|jgi:predicted glutamine amidotransferase|nr:class II glutamine amidotransferase [bacterium]